MLQVHAQISRCMSKANELEDIERIKQVRILSDIFTNQQDNFQIRKLYVTCLNDQTFVVS